MVGVKRKTPSKIQREGRYGRYKCRSKIIKYVKTPGGKTVIHYREGKPSKAKCASCSTVLAGVPRERPYKMQNMAKTKKRPERPYGGKLCSKCMRDRKSVV